MTNRSQSFWASAWRRLQKNRGAMAGLVMITLSVLVALVAFFLPLCYGYIVYFVLPALKGLFKNGSTFSPLVFL